MAFGFVNKRGGEHAPQHGDLVTGGSQNWGGPGSDIYMAVSTNGDGGRKTCPTWGPHNCWFLKIVWWKVKGGGWNPKLMIQHHHQLPKVVCDKASKVDGYGKRCCICLLFVCIWLVCLFVCCRLCVLAWCLWFLVMSVLGGWCLFGHFSLLKETNHFKVGFGGHRIMGHWRKDYKKRSLMLCKKGSTLHLFSLIIDAW